MNWLRWALAGSSIVALAFVLGLITAPSGRAAARPAQRAAAEPPPAAPDLVYAPAAPPGMGRPRFTPPPLPANDPGVAELVRGPDEPPAEALKLHHMDLDRRIDEVLGQDFPQAKRAALFKADTDWMREHGRAVRAYYHGEISQDELTARIHANMLTYARTMETAWSSSEYARFMKLEPGADPFVVLMPEGVKAGEPLVDPAAAAAANRQKPAPVAPPLSLDAGALASDKSADAGASPPTP